MPLTPVSVPDIQPNTYLPGTASITQLLGGIQAWLIYASIAAILGGGILWALSSMGDNMRGTRRGKEFLLSGLGGAFLVGVCPDLVRWAVNTGTSFH